MKDTQSKEIKVLFATPNTRRFKPPAVAGIMLNNGDVIADSLHLDGYVSSFVTMREDTVAIHYPLTRGTGLFVGCGVEP